MKKTIFSTIILLTVTGCAVPLPEDELSLTRSKLEHFLQTREMTQSEMNLINSYALQLSNMEKAQLEYRICNRPDYRKIEKAGRFIMSSQRLIPYVLPSVDCNPWRSHLPASSLL